MNRISMKKFIYIIVGILIITILGFGGQWYYGEVYLKSESVAELQRREIENLKKTVEEGDIKLQLTDEAAKKISSDPNTISIEEIKPYIEGVAEVRCYAPEGYLVASGSASLWDFLGDFQYVALTNAHVISEGECALLYYRYGEGKGSEIGDESFADEFFNVNTVRVSDPAFQEDVAVLQMVPDSGRRQEVLPQLDYRFSQLGMCPLRMPQGSPVAAIGFPSFASRQGTDFGLGDNLISSRTLTTGIISGYDTRPIGSALPSVNYFVTAVIDAGNSGGAAVSKHNGNLCLLGLPTWVSFGYYANQGVVQNIHNISHVWQK